MQSSKSIRTLLSALVIAVTALLLLSHSTLSTAQEATGSAVPNDYVLAPGDIVHIQVYQNPDLTTDTRVAESGRISFPLLGGVQIGGLTVAQAEALIAKQLADGRLVVKPQVIVLLQEVRGNQVAVLGLVNKPGRYPLETNNVRVSDMLAMAGGIAEKGGNTVIVSGTRHGKAFRQQLDVPAMYNSGDFTNDILLAGGDSIYVNPAPVFFIYGEVQHPGIFRLDRDMMLMQAVAAGGGSTPRGSLKGIQVSRRNANGKVVVIEPKMDEQLQPNDVVFVRESIF
ncbi:polysaccharide export protein EpsE [Uliginosibacterium sp. H3]|uniref:Polysaccharide export protein EpsE n=1 Tax=Uliginosibacterium silvisoli TaxID=3114758 RepID=A0ABU6K885_9RHOO|nr:polysaccharide export protein EpsE [Uliginosibacterium sp. H3]